MCDRMAIKKKVIKMVAEQMGKSPNRINEDADLYRDLKIYGDDIDELLDDLAKEFDFHPLNELDVSDCFAGEAHMFNPLPTLFFKPKRRIRVKHLIDAIWLKKLPEFENV